MQREGRGFSTPWAGVMQRRLAGHALVQNVRRGCYELAVEEPASRRVAVAFDKLASAI